MLPFIFSFHFPYQGACPAGALGCVSCCFSSLGGGLAYNNNDDNIINNDNVKSFPLWIVKLKWKLALQIGRIIMYVSES